MKQKLTFQSLGLYFRFALKVSVSHGAIDQWPETYRAKPLSTLNQGSRMAFYAP